MTLLRRGDQVWWINGVHERRTGVVMEDQRYEGDHVWVHCHEIDSIIRPRHPQLISPEDDQEIAS